MIFLGKEIIAQIKAEYPVGSRVELMHMEDAYRKDMILGLKGTVISVDDIGTIHVHWDNGSCLGVLYGEDSCRRITPVKD